MPPEKRGWARLGCRAHLHVDLAGAGVPGRAGPGIAQRAERCSLTSSGTSSPTLPSSCRAGAKPGSAVISSTTHKIRDRSPGSLASGRICNAKIDDRISLIVASCASIATLARCTTSGEQIRLPKSSEFSEDLNEGRATLAALLRATPQPQPASPRVEQPL
jgi:hypothetical protein